MTIDYSAGASLAEAITTCQTALASLQRLGRSADADTLLTDAEATSYDAILNDGTRSDAWKLQTCAQRYTSVMATSARQLTAAATTAGNQDADDAARVYGIKGLAGDVASLSISRRDAGDRVASITDTVQRQRLLAQADKNRRRCAGPRHSRSRNRLVRRRHHQPVRRCVPGARRRGAAALGFRHAPND